MFDSLAGKVVLVTGGSSGIGKAIVAKLLEYKMKVAFTYNTHKSDLLEFTKSMEEDESVIKPYKLNIKNSEEVQIVVQTIEKELGSINFLVNCAGVTGDSLMFMMDHEIWENVLDTNLSGNFRVTQAVLPSMLGHNGGAIVNISSIAGISGVAGQSNYCASKAGIIGLTKALAKEMAIKNIRVNAIAPGYIDTDMIKEVMKKNNKLAEQIPMKRVGKAEEIASIVLFLLSEGASYITGTVITADGGLLA